MRALLEQGMSGAEIAADLRISRASVSYHKRRLGFPMAVRKRYDWPAVQRYYDAGHSVRECCRHFGFSAKSFHDAKIRGAIVCRPRALPIEELLIAGPRSRINIKRRLVAGGFKRYECEDCEIGEWRGSTLSLSLHHVNGDRHDNRLENLRLLCPNCHSQTPNFGSRNWSREAA